RRSRDGRLPLRGRRPRIDLRLLERPRGQARFARRDGPLPGPRLRTRAPVPVRLGFGYGTPAGPAGAPGQPGRFGGVSNVAIEWRGVFPAVTTPFREDLSLDLEFLPRHLEAMLEAGCRGFVPLGSLGESATLTFEEKGAVLAACRGTLGPRAALVAGVAAPSTPGGVAAARLGRRAGRRGRVGPPAHRFPPARRAARAALSPRPPGSPPPRHL